MNAHTDPNTKIYILKWRNGAPYVTPNDHCSEFTLAEAMRIAGSENVDVIDPETSAVIWHGSEATRGGVQAGGRTDGVQPIPPGPARDALEAIRDALAIPYAATVGDEKIRAKIIEERIMHAVGMLQGILGEDAYPDVPWSVAYLRARLAEHPAEGYKTWDERMAEIAAARRAGGQP
jgi:hypothetical protein